MRGCRQHQPPDMVPGKTNLVAEQFFDTRGDRMAKGNMGFLNKRGLIRWHHDGDISHPGHAAATLAGQRNRGDAVVTGYFKRGNDIAGIA